jgi:hypothetical protein
MSLSTAQFLMALSIELICKAVYLHSDIGPCGSIPNSEMDP